MQQIMETEIKWEFINPNEVELSLPRATTIENFSVINWRGEDITIHIRIITNDFGFDRYDKISYKNESYQVIIRKFKWNIGLFGDKKYPVISNGNHTLEFKFNVPHYHDKHTITLVDQEDLNLNSETENSIFSLITKKQL